MNNIHVVDNFLSNTEFNKIIDILNTKFWKYGHGSGNREIIVNRFFSTTNVEDFFQIHILHKIEAQFSKKFQINRHYMHIQTFGQDGGYHIDNNFQNAWTFCLYITEVTHDILENNGGEFLIRIPQENFILSIETQNNTGLLFPSNYLHKGMAYHRYIPNYRLCITWKLIEILDRDTQLTLSNNNNISSKKITIITPSYRIQNLILLFDSIDFNYVNEWIIVYDGNKIKENPYFFRSKNISKIKEFLYRGYGQSGNAQRNYALTKITSPNTYIYYLDDDNVIHKNLYKFLDKIEINKIYTFNQENGLKGDKIELNCIDTAMFLIDYNLCKNYVWDISKYNADGYYIKDCYSHNKDKHVYIDADLCYYNFISSMKIS
jgi:hypothetical protein